MGFKLLLQRVLPPPPPPPPPKPVAVKAPASTTPRTVSGPALKAISGESAFEGGGVAKPAPQVSATIPFAGQLSKVMQGVTGLISGGVSRMREAVAVAKLPPDQRQAYLATQAALRQSGDTQGEAALKDMLLNHPERLTVKDPKTGRTTLDCLADLAKPGATSKIPGASVTQVLGQTVRDLSNPEGMVQGDDDLCGTLSAQQQMAQSDPAGYAALLSGLTLQGSATVSASGYTLRMPESARVDASRSSTQQLVGQALLGSMVNPNAYSVGNDGSRTRQTQETKFLEENGVEDLPPPTRYGTEAGDQAWAQQALLGGDYQGEKIPPNDPRATAAAKQTLVEQTANGKPVSVLMSPPEGSTEGHWVTVTGVDPKANTITYVENGVSKTEDLDAFLAGTTQGTDGQSVHPRIEALTFDSSVATPGQPPEDLIDWRSDDGGGGRLGGATVPSSDGKGT